MKSYYIFMLLSIKYFQLSLIITLTNFNLFFCFHSSGYSTIVSKEVIVFFCHICFWLQKYNNLCLCVSLYSRSHPLQPYNQIYSIIMKLYLKQFLFVHNLGLINPYHVLIKTNFDISALLSEVNFNHFHHNHYSSDTHCSASHED